MNTEVECPICGARSPCIVRDGRDFFVYAGATPPFDVHYCSACEVGFSVPFLSDEQLAPYYPTSYEAYSPKRSLHGVLQKWKYRQDIKLLSKFIDTRSAQISIFELGAGRGEFLAAIRDTFGGEAKLDGVEPSEAGCRTAHERYGISLANRYANEVKFEDGYDVIVMRHVVEHLNAPDEVLRNIFEHGLKARGMLFLKLPAMDSWATRAFGRYTDAFDFPRHRVHFTRRGLTKLLERIGYSNIRIMDEVVPTSLVRPIRYFAAHGTPGFRRTLARILVKLPNGVLFGIAQIIGLMLAPLGSDRMIVVATKANE